MNKKRYYVTITAAMTCLILMGCHPKRIVWTANGQQALIWSDSGLFFADAAGKISSNVYDGVVRAAWFPDGQHLAIEKVIYAKSWDEAQAKIPAKLLEDLVRYAQPMLDVKNQDQWQTKTKALQDLQMLSNNEIRGIKMYIRDKAAGNFPKSLIDSWKGECDFNCYTLQVGIWKDGKFSIEKTLFSSGQRIWDFRFSAKGRVFAFTTAYPKDDSKQRNVSSLWVADTETARVVMLDENVALYPDWDAEGTSLFYVRSIGDGKTGDVVGTLLSSRVCDDQGALLSEFQSPVSLAGLAANEYTKVRCLSDGRVLFSSFEVTLPVVGKDVPEQKQLFALDTRRQSAINHLIPNGILSRSFGYNLDFFEVSPDQKKVSIPDDKGRVAVLTLATGDFLVLQGQDLDKISTVPVWRYPDQLCYVDKMSEGLLGDKKSKQVMLRKAGDENGWPAPDIISKNWPKEAGKGWLED